MKLSGFVTTIASVALTTLASVAPALAEWVHMGQASTGEEIYVDSDSISWGSEAEGVRFRYSIGDETLRASTKCDGSWYVLEYDQYYTPQSETTYFMLRYVCDVAQSR